MSRKNDNFKGKRFPFWARVRISKQRTTLVIDDIDIINNTSGQSKKGFVHREATHTKRKGYERISPNPDRSDPNDMFLKPPRIRPQRDFEPHNKRLRMPKNLLDKYDKNNDKSNSDF